MGLALTGTAFAAYRWLSPTVGGPLFERHPNLKTCQQLLTPIALDLAGVGLVVAALSNDSCLRSPMSGIVFRGSPAPPG